MVAEVEPGGDRLAVQHGGDAVAAEPVVLVEGDDEQAVVGLGPGRRRRRGGSSARCHRSRPSSRACRCTGSGRRRRPGQLREVGGELRRRFARDGGRDVAEAEPRVVLLGVVAAAAGGRALAGQRLVVARPGLAGGDQLGGEVGLLEKPGV